MQNTHSARSLWATNTHLHSPKLVEIRLVLPEVIWEERVAVPLVTVGRPKFTLKLSLSLRRSPPHLIHPTWPTPAALSTPNGIWIHSAVLPQYTFQTDWQT